MLIGLKSKLVVYGAVFAIAGGLAWHYRSVIAKNADLVRTVLELQIERDEYATQVRAEREAARIATEEREALQRALRALRAGQAADTDPEFVEWRSQRIPPTERARICQALPGAAGCD
jgi:hypothetical protein